MWCEIKNELVGNGVLDLGRHQRREHVLCVSSYSSMCKVVWAAATSNHRPRVCDDKLASARVWLGNHYITFPSDVWPRRANLSSLAAAARAHRGSRLRAKLRSPSASTHPIHRLAWQTTPYLDCALCIQCTS